MKNTAHHITANMRFATAHPNPYGIRIPAKRSQNVFMSITHKFVMHLSIKQ